MTMQAGVGRPAGTTWDGDDLAEPEEAAAVHEHELTKLHVAIVSMNAHPFGRDDTTGPGRQQREYVSRLAVSLADKGHDVRVHTTRSDEGAVQVHRDVRLDEVSDGAEDGPCVALLEQAKRQSAHLLEVWSQEPPDVVYAHSWRSGVAAQVAARELGVPVVQTFYGLSAATRQMAEGSRPTKDWRARLQLAVAVARASDGVIALSSSDVEALVRLGVGRTRTALVPRGIDPAQVPDAVPAPDLEGPLRVLALFTPDDRTGLDELLWAADRVRGVELTVAWVGPDPAPQVDVAAGDQHVRSHSVGADGVSGLIEGADVVAALSPKDDLVGPVLHAMALGRPVIGVDGGAVADAVVDHVTGLLVHPLEQGRLLRALSRLVDDRCEVEAMGQAANDRVATRYPWHRIADESLAVLAGAAS